MTARPRDRIRHGLSGVWDAVLVPGGDVSSLCGDALFIDPGRGIFALGDGSEKSPGAAERFLTLFMNRLEEPGLAAEKYAGNEESRFRAISSMTDEIVGNTDTRESTTFSAVIVKERRALVLHTGDSLIYVIHDSGTGPSVIQLSRTCHLMVGRTAGLYQKEVITLHEGDRLILATDGLTDLSRAMGMSPSALLAGVAAGKDPGVITETLVSMYRSTGKTLDDLGVVAAVPEMLDTLLPVHKEKVILSER